MEPQGRVEPLREELFGPYRLEAVLGEGGMGRVYQALDTRKERRVALKRLLVEGHGEEMVTRFRREAETVARLNDPHVIPIHDYGEIDGMLFLDMRLVEGRDLGAEIAARGPLPTDRAVGIVTQAAGALDAAHRDGLVHRDVKPANILLSQVTNEDYVYLVDFGIAHAAERTRLTSIGGAVGTLAYMAPERFDDRGGDHRVDVYALGCVLFESLTGRPPFTQRSVAALIGAHVHAVPPRVTDLRPDLPRGLDDVLASALAKDPGARPSSAGELALAARDVLAGRTIDRHAGSVGSDPHASAPSVPPARSRSHLVRRVLVGTGAALVLGAGAVGVATVNGQPEAPEVVGPGAPDGIATQLIGAFAGHDVTTLQGLSCRGLANAPSGPIPNELIDSIRGARQDGPAQVQFDTQARVPILLTTTGPAVNTGETYTGDLAVDLVLGVSGDHWCLSGIANRT